MVLVLILVMAIVMVAVAVMVAVEKGENFDKAEAALGWVRPI